MRECDLQGREGFPGRVVLLEVEIGARRREQARGVPPGQSGEQPMDRPDDETGRRHVHDRAELVLRARELLRGGVLGEGERGLVAVVPVGDDRLGVLDEALELDVGGIVGDAEGVVAHAVGVGGREVRRAASRERGREGSPGHEEDELEVGLRRGQQREPVGLRLCERALVGSDDSGLVLREADEADEGVAHEGLPAVREGLAVDPEGRPALLLERAVGEPVGQRLRRRRRTDPSPSFLRKVTRTMFSGA